eukprot:467647-Prorocentrum_minimum.AAC.1
MFEQLYVHCQQLEAEVPDGVVNVQQWQSRGGRFIGLIRLLRSAVVLDSGDGSAGGGLTWRLVTQVLYVPAPVLWLEAKQLHEMREFEHYNCPVYRTADRRGVLATTGHSTNFLRMMRLPSAQPQDHWTLRGVCMLCSLPE